MSVALVLGVLALVTGHIALVGCSRLLPPRGALVGACLALVDGAGMLALALPGLLQSLLGSRPRCAGPLIGGGSALLRMLGAVVAVVGHARIMTG
jgi:hypothetical protein